MKLSLDDLALSKKELHKKVLDIISATRSKREAAKAKKIARDNGWQDVLDIFYSRIKKYRLTENEIDKCLPKAWQ